MGGDSERNEPYNLEGEYLEIAKESIYDRYQYIRHMYTCLFEVSQWGGSCFDPLFYYYPMDNETFSQIESSFMISGSLKVSPLLHALEGNVTTFSSYFPAGKWVNLVDYSVIDTSAGGNWTILNVSKTVNVHLREGSIVTKQINNNHTFNSTSDFMDKVPITLIANRDGNGQAYGTLFLDTSDSREEISNGAYEYI
jgi:alpha-glucosidase (family GH31 glycosyl hydrolase)